VYSRGSGKVALCVCACIPNIKSTCTTSAQQYGTGALTVLSEEMKHRELCFKMCLNIASPVLVHLSLVFCLSEQYFYL
jgi:hypothetical protein